PDVAKYPGGIRDRWGNADVLPEIRIPAATVAAGRQPVTKFSSDTAWVGPRHAMVCLSGDGFRARLLGPDRRRIRQPADPDDLPPAAQGARVDARLLQNRAAAAKGIGRELPPDPGV